MIEVLRSVVSSMDSVLGLKTATFSLVASQGCPSVLASELSLPWSYSTLLRRTSVRVNWHSPRWPGFN